MERKFDDPDERIAIEHRFTAVMRLLNQSAMNYGWNLDTERPAFQAGRYQIVEEVRQARGRAPYTRFNVEQLVVEETKDGPRERAKALSWAPTIDEALTNLIGRIVREVVEQVFSAVDSLLEAAAALDAGDDEGEGPAQAAA